LNTFTFGASVPSTPAEPEGRHEGLRERNKREKRARILAAARQLFERQGFEATTARQICRRAQIGTGTLFLYVRDKRELLFLVFRDEARGRYRSGMAKAEAQAALPDALLCLFGEFIDFYARNPSLSKLIVEELFYRPQEPESMGALTEEFLACVAALLAAARARGELRDDAAAADQVSAFFAHYSFWVQAWLGSGVCTREQAEAGLRRAIELQIEGLAPAQAVKR
jgi:AcrR family transcriptional regulator